MFLCQSSVMILPVPSAPLPQFCSGRREQTQWSISQCIFYSFSFFCCCYCFIQRDGEIQRMQQQLKQQSFRSYCSQSLWHSPTHSDSHSHIDILLFGGIFSDLVFEVCQPLWFHRTIAITTISWSRPPHAQPIVSQEHSSKPNNLVYMSYCFFCSNPKIMFCIKFLALIKKLWLFQVFFFVWYRRWSM